MSGAVRRWRSSYRRHILVGVVLVVVASVIGQFLVSTAISARVKSAERRALQQQAQIFANEVARAPADEMNRTAGSVAKLLPDTRIVVTHPGPGGLYYNVVQPSRHNAEVSATSGGVEVRLAREYNQTSTSPWAVVAIIALIGVLATVIFVLAESVARRLRRQVSGLADTASQFASGDWSARAVETNDELGRAAASFNRMADRLEEADVAQRRFLADVAHELRTPVTAIDGFAAALGDGAAGTEEDRAEAVGFIREEAARLRELVSDLRNLTHLDLGGAALNLRSVDLADRARHVVQRLAASAEEAGVALLSEGDAVMIRTDPRHVDTVLSNLTANALTATPAGGEVRIEVSATPDGAEMVVRDTGRGIAPEDRERIFDRLYRVDRSRSRNDGGSGLGLAIVKRLVRQLDGTIEVTSEVGVGTAFSVRLPPDVEPASTVPTPSEEAPSD